MADEEQRTGALLRGRAQDLPRLLEGLPVAIFVTDASGSPVYLNPAAVDLLGVGVIPGAKLDELPELYRSYVAGTDDPYPVERSTISQALKGKRATSDDLEIHRPDGVRRLQVSTSPIFDDDGKVVLAVAVLEDVTDAKANETQLRLTHELALAISGAATLEDALAIAVRRVGEQTGWSFGQAWLPDPTGSYLECVRVLHCGSKKFNKFRAASEATTFALGAGLPGATWATKRAKWVENVEEEAGFTRAGAAREVGLKSGVAVPVMAGDEAVAVLEFFLTHTRTEDVRSRELVGAVAAQLGSFVRRRQAEDALRRSERELRAMDRIKNTFLHGVSHELRTPLGAMRGISMLLARDLDRQEPKLSLEQQRTLLHRLANTTRTMNRLLDDLLDLDRLVLGILEPERIRTDVAQIVRDLIGQSEAAGSRLVELDLETAVISVDQSKLERIVENLVSNAAKYTPSDSPIWVRVRAVPGGVMVSVEDAGAGVPQEMRDRIFEPFTRGAGDTDAPGLGIGLSLVAAFAQLHGGRAWVEEREGGGASFRVLLADDREESVPSPEVSRFGASPA
ncbi:MAG: GAF domain-containing protein [Actinobacteria bacterium]|nr:GAF domain-containing protein [Actinomycetota bacterium]